MGTQNLNFAAKFPPNEDFQRKILYFWKKIFRNEIFIETLLHVLHISLLMCHCIYSAIQLSSCKCVFNKLSCQLSVERLKVRWWKRVGGECALQEGPSCPLPRRY